MFQKSLKIISRFVFWFFLSLIFGYFPVAVVMMILVHFLTGLNYTLGWGEPLNLLVIIPAIFATKMCFTDKFDLLTKSSVMVIAVFVAELLLEAILPPENLVRNVVSLLLLLTLFFYLFQIGRFFFVPLYQIIRKRFPHNK